MSFGIAYHDIGDQVVRPNPISQPDQVRGDRLREHLLPIPTERAERARHRPSHGLVGGDQEDTLLIPVLLNLLLTLLLNDDALGPVDDAGYLFPNKYMNSCNTSRQWQLGTENLFG